MINWVVREVEVERSVIVVDRDRVDVSVTVEIALKSRTSCEALVLVVTEDGEEVITTTEELVVVSLTVEVEEEKRRLCLLNVTTVVSAAENKTIMERVVLVLLVMVSLTTVALIKFCKNETVRVVWTISVLTMELTSVTGLKLRMLVTISVVRDDVVGNMEVVVVVASVEVPVTRR